MKIKYKFIIAAVILLLLPVVFSINLTRSLLQEHLDFIPFLNEYNDIFTSFSEYALSFDEVVKENAHQPDIFFQRSFQEKLGTNFQSPYIFVQIQNKGEVLFTSPTQPLLVPPRLSQWLSKDSNDDKPQSSYALKHHQLRTEEGATMDLYLLVDSVKLQESRLLFQRLFFLIYASINLILLGFFITWMSRPLQTSLKKMTHTTNEIGLGHLETTLLYNENDDFEALAQSIERMRRSLKDAKEKQNRLVEEKKELIANISHDLRTPITSIRGYVQGLKDGVPKSEEQKMEYLETIESKTYMVESLVNDLNEIAKYDAQMIQLQKQPISLKHFLTDCTDALQKDVAKVGGSLSLHYIIKDLTISIDPEKLMRVFINCIENAIKYRSQKTLEIIILVNQDDDGAFINITDNGIGVPSNEVDFIFQRFYRTDKSRNLNVAGSGIGLSISQEIIEAHHGKISAFNNDNQGLTVSIRLPEHHDIR